MAYYSIEPWGPERAELSIATLTSLTANVHRDAKKRPEAFTAKDFLPQWGVTSEREEEDGMAPDRIMNLMEGFMRQQEISTKADASRRRKAEQALGQ